MSALADSAFFVFETFAAAYIPVGEDSVALHLMGLAHTVALATVAFHAFSGTSAVV